MFLLDSSYWQVKRAGHKGRGVFARAAIGPGTVIGDYIGTVISPSECDDARGGIYGLQLHDNAVFFPDVSSVGVHLINHSCMPNTGMYPYRGHMLYAAVRRIFPGEELTVSYMVAPPDEFLSKGLSYPCFCGTQLCTGSMLISPEKARAYWDGFVRRGTGAFMNMYGRQYGKALKPLREYPDTMPDDTVFDLSGNGGVPPVTCAASVLTDIPRVRMAIRNHGTRIEIRKPPVRILAVSHSRLVVEPFLP